MDKGLVELLRIQMFDTLTGKFGPDLRYSTAAYRHDCKAEMYADRTRKGLAHVQANLRALAAAPQHPVNDEELERMLAVWRPNFRPILDAKLEARFMQQRFFVHQAKQRALTTFLAGVKRGDKPGDLRGRSTLMVIGSAQFAALKGTLSAPT